MPDDEILTIKEVAAISRSLKRPPIDMYRMV